MSVTRRVLVPCAGFDHCVGGEGFRGACSSVAVSVFFSYAFSAKDLKRDLRFHRGMKFCQGPCFSLAHSHFPGLV